MCLSSRFEIQLFSLGHNNKKGPEDSKLDAVTQADQWLPTKKGQRGNHHGDQQAQEDSTGCSLPKRKTLIILWILGSNPKGNEKWHIFCLPK